MQKNQRDWISLNQKDHIDIIQGLSKLCLLKHYVEPDINELKVVCQLLGLIAEQNNEGRTIPPTILLWVLKEKDFGGGLSFTIMAATPTTSWDPWAFTILTWEYGCTGLKTHGWPGSADLGQCSRVDKWLCRCLGSVWSLSSGTLWRWRVPGHRLQPESKHLQSDF